jgi:MFS family permease
VLINLTPLVQYRDFRLLFIGQMVSYLGSMISYVAVPYQVYELTKSSAIVGALGAVQLGPLLLFGLLGGSFADSLDRRRLLWVSEAVMCLGALGLAVNATLPEPSVAVIFALVALMQAATGFHRPAMDALTQKLVLPEHYAAVGALNAFRSSAGAIAGPALGGILIASVGAPAAFLIDFGTFLIAIICVLLMKSVPTPEKLPSPGLESIAEGLRYAVKRPELVGTYVVDIVAMTFAFPTALFPALAEQWGGAKAAGILFSAMSIGSLFITLFSGWTSRVHRHGAAVIIAAALWGAAIVGFGLAPGLWLAVVFLALAGAADMVSGLFRSVIWNETIPNEMRGRLAGIEMISYMSGPLLGNFRAGTMAGFTSPAFSIVSGGALCVVGVVACAFVLPRFWGYRKAA